MHAYIIKSCFIYFLYSTRGQEALRGCFLSLQGLVGRRQSFVLSLHRAQSLNLTKRGDLC